MKYLLFTIALGIVLALAGVLAGDILHPSYEPEEILCNGDSLTCPDGSIHYRRPPYCEFAACAQ